MDPSLQHEISIIRERVLLTERLAASELHEVSGAAGTLELAVIDVPSFYVPWHDEETTGNGAAILRMQIPNSASLEIGKTYTQRTRNEDGELVGYGKYVRFAKGTCALPVGDKPGTLSFQLRFANHTRAVKQ